MRKLSIVAAFAAVIACGSDPPPPANPPPPAPVATNTTPTPTTTTTTTAPPPKKPLAELQQATGKTLAQAMMAGDAKKAASVYTNDAVLKFAGAPDVTGRDGIEKALTQFFTAFSKIKMGESRVFVKDEVVVSEWVMNATHSGEFMGTKASEKPVGWVGASVDWFNDEGQIKEEHIYWNPATVLFQIGATKEKNRAVPSLPSKPEVVMAQHTSDEEKNMEVIRHINDAWEQKKEADWLAMLTDNAEWDDITLLEPAKGKQGVLKYFKAFTTAFPDAKLKTINQWGVGDWVIEEGTYTGTNTGSLFGAPPTKKSMTIHELNVILLDKDDNIVKAVTYGNDLEMTSQLKPAPAAKAADKK